MTDDELIAMLLAEDRRLMEMDDESFDMLVVASRDEILRAMDEGDLAAELRGRHYQALCDAVARRR